MVVENKMYATTVCVQNTYLLLCTSVSIAIGLVYEEQPPTVQLL